MLLQVFEEMPPDLHRMEGLHYLVRRLDGTPNPRNGAPATAWAARRIRSSSDNASTRDSFSSSSPDFL